MICQMYVGPDFDLQGERALIRPHPDLKGFVLAQFNSHNLVRWASPTQGIRLGYTWTPFPAQYFS